MFHHARYVVSLAIDTRYIFHLHGSLIVFVSAAALTVVAADYGFGEHYWTIDPVDAPISLKIFYATQVLYIFLVILPKGKFCWAGAGLTILEDIAILLFPIPELRKLKLSFAKKVGVFFMFGIGSFACVASMVRLRYMVHFVHTLDATWENVDVVIESFIEICLAIICGNLPALRPLISRIRNKVTSWFTSPAQAVQQSGATESTSGRLVPPKESNEELHVIVAS
ncbi:hypothetical protein F5X68DRAFT_232386 [Plectosphaerella plurivora]|uniref:Rhodopsin domain-containing protein n=1 Tax=Plectosphaerella plurivora TaxID=936078 RepID=A0A9P8VC41_9PEZI|nr:hypothetical protein F5X68DRAFT_232386 [Plectosphaerella plurivora]